jgi:hypothetical protein
VSAGGLRSGRNPEAQSGSKAASAGGVGANAVYGFARAERGQTRANFRWARQALLGPRASRGTGVEAKKGRAAGAAGAKLLREQRDLLGRRAGVSRAYEVEGCAGGDLLGRDDLESGSGVGEGDSECIAIEE